MDVAISILRAELSTWIERARAGEEVVVTDRGTPVARLLAVDTAPLLDQLIQRGVRLLVYLRGDQDPMTSPLFPPNRLTCALLARPISAPSGAGLG